MTTKNERHLIATLCGRTADFGQYATPPEFKAEDPIDLRDEETIYTVKALMIRLGNDLPALRRLMSGNNRFQDAFNENVNEVLVRIAQLEKTKEVAAKKAASKKQPNAQKIERR
jgi:hypothetical protein